MATEIRNYTELRRKIGDALRSEHPEWIEPGGTSPRCDYYEARFAEILNLFAAREEGQLVEA
jgi:hypothetical protein